MLQAKGYQAILEIIVQSVNKSEYVDGAVILAMDEPYSIGGAVNPADGEVCSPNRFVGDFVKRHENLYFGASVILIERLPWMCWSRQSRMGSPHQVASQYWGYRPFQFLL
tara:strand:- start:669 stop:998 length:330 start_codon:yes stop_codon:yes gene_type:complete